MQDRTITINSISKTYSVTVGGWAGLSPRRESRNGFERCMIFLQWERRPLSSMPRRSHCIFLQAIICRLPKNVSAAAWFFVQRIKWHWFYPYLPKGSYYMITDVGNDSLTKEQGRFWFQQKIIKVTGVATVPDFLLCQPKKIRKQVRFAFCKRWETLEM